MATVLIVDDEKKICQLIHHLADWREYNLEVIGYEHDGKKALMRICEERPDIVITDVRMPSMDGLEIIKYCREKDVLCQFIVISGFAQFEYAQNAVKYDVSDYLLKPVNRDELNIALKKINERITRFKEESLQRELLSYDLDISVRQLKQQYLKDIVLENRLFSEQQLYGQCKFSSDCNIWKMIIVKADCRLEDNLQFVNLALVHSQNLIQENISFLCNELVMYIDDCRLFCLSGYEDENSDSIKNQLLKCGLDLEMIISSYGGIQLTICLGSEIDDLRHIQKSLVVARKAEAYRLIRTKGNISVLPPKIRESKPELILTIQKKNKLYSELEKGDLKSVKEEIRLLYSDTLNMYGSDIDAELLYDLTKLLIDLFKDYFTKQSNQWIETPDFSLVYNRAEHLGSVLTFGKNISEMIVGILEKYYASVEANSIKPIRRAVKYIAVHYAEALTLEQVADIVHFSPNYFSKVFKEETGVNFTEYLTTYRMTMAKKFLRETDESIAVIALMSGYQDAKYFSKLFSKTYGVTPNKYRKI